MHWEPYTSVVLTIVFVAALTRSTLGFGEALVAMPLLSLFIDIEIATPVIALISVLIAGVILLEDWHHIQITSARRLVVFSLVGIPAGLYFLNAIDERIVKGTLAVVIMAFSSYQLLRPRRFVLTTDRFAPVFGFLAGMLGGAYKTDGPPLIVYGTLRKWSAEHFRATMQGYFLPTGLLILCGHWASGLWVAGVFRYFLACLPGVLLATWLGKRLNRYVRGENFVNYVHVILIVIGAVLLVQSAAD